MRLTPAIAELLAALTRALAEHCSMSTGQAHEAAVRMLDKGGGLAGAVDKIRRESFESGASPALSVLLSELQDSLPGAYQEGLARAVTLLSQEMGQHYGSVFEAGVRIGRIQAANEAAGDAQ
jgi:hypothetical protein